MEINKDIYKKMEFVVKNIDFTKPMKNKHMDWTFDDERDVIELFTTTPYDKETCEHIYRNCGKNKEKALSVIKINLAHNC